ncbi:MAG: hypothetical protein HY537_01315 [Deltaproteobacteria bacterium]|nr:hypothetical protein [Deltaproteobacteria bacterium]
MADRYPGREIPVRLVQGVVQGVLARILLLAQAVAVPQLRAVQDPLTPAELVRAVLPVQQGRATPPVRDRPRAVERARERLLVRQSPQQMAVLFRAGRRVRPAMVVAHRPAELPAVERSVMVPDQRQEHRRELHRVPGQCPAREVLARILLLAPAVAAPQFRVIQDLQVQAAGLPVPRMVERLVPVRPLAVMVDRQHRAGLPVARALLHLQALVPRTAALDQELLPLPVARLTQAVGQRVEQRLPLPAERVPVEVLKQTAEQSVPQALGLRQILVVPVERLAAVLERAVPADPARALRADLRGLPVAALRLQEEPPAAQRVEVPARRQAIRIRVPKVALVKGPVDRMVVARPS